MKKWIFVVQVPAVLIEKRIGCKVWGLENRKKIKKAKIDGCLYFPFPSSFLFLSCSCARKMVSRICELGTT